MYTLNTRVYVMYYISIYTCICHVYIYIYTHVGYVYISIDMYKDIVNLEG